MSKSIQRVATGEERTDTIVGIITVVAVLALIAWLFISMSVRAQAIKLVASADEVRRGQEQTFTANVESPKVKDGSDVKWIVNGEVVSEGVYTAGEPLTLNYAPKTVGTNYVSVQVARYNEITCVDVLPPQLTVAAPNLVMTYGEQMPDFKYECSGFVDEDSADMLEYNGTCYLCNDNDERLTADKLNVGVYKLSMEQDCCFKDYDVCYVGGTLTVLPAKLKLTGNFVKTYDQSNVIENPQIKLLGVQEGDDVTTNCDKLYFNDKNVGYNKPIMIGNVELTGADARNYVLDGEARGGILPKQVEIDGLVIRDKTYDGTTRAQIDKMGTLEGVIEGDSVAIGSLELSFEDASVGEQQIVLNNVTLIGADKDNYEVSGVDVQNASINATLWDRIFVKNPAVTADNA